MDADRRRHDELLANYRAQKEAEERREGRIGLAVALVALSAMPFVHLLPDDPIEPGWIFGLGAVLFFLMALADLRLQARARSWKRTDCRIEFAIVERFRRGTSLPVVGYSYTWAGQEHLGTRLRRSMAGTSRDAAVAEIAGYQVGARHECFVNPNKPSDAILHTNGSMHAPGIFLGIGTLFLGLWVAFAQGWLGG